MDFARRTAAEFKGAYPWADEASIEVMLAVYAANVALLNAGRQLTRALGLGRPAGRFSVLRALAFAPEQRLSHKEIAGRLLIGKASVTDLVRGLEQDGLVTRVRSEHDRRSFLVSLTPRGEAVSARYLPAMARLASKFSAELSERERRQLAKLLVSFSRAAPEDPLEVLEES